MKKILSTILILAMLLSTAALVVFPASAADTTATEPYIPEGTAIDDLTDFKNMTSGTSSSYKKYYLAADITLDSSFVPKTLNYFMLDGKDTNGVQHKIHFNDAQNSAFAGSTSPIIKNLTLTGDITYSIDTNYISPLFNAEASNPKLSNIDSSVNITTDRQVDECIGGVIGWISDTGDTQLENLTYSGDITLDHYAKAVGGIVGIVSCKNTSGTFKSYIKNCTKKNGDIYMSSAFLSASSGWSVGGIVGNMWNDGGGITVEGCVNDSAASITQETGATVVQKDETRTIGGIVARLNAGQSCKIKDCVNRMSVEVEHSVNFGGIVSYIERSKETYNPSHVIEGCENHGDFTFTNTAKNVGGISALVAQGKITVKDSVNHGDISYTKDVRVVNHEGLGGIVGKIYHDSKATNDPGVDPYRETVLHNCANFGNLTVADGVRSANNTNYDYHIGGIAGRAHKVESLRINRCTNYGNVSAICTAAVGRWHTTSGVLGTLITSSGTMYLQITNSHNKGNVTGKYSGGMLGATFQLYYVQTVTSYDEDPNNKNTGTIKGTSGPHKIKIDISHCSNSGTITGTYDNTWEKGSGWGNKTGDAGGIVGAMDQSDGNGGVLSIKYCVNEGNIRGGRFAAGILAVRTPLNLRVPSTADSTKWVWEQTQNENTYIDNCVNTGKIETKSGESYFPAGGIVSSAKGYFEITNCLSHGTLAPLTTGTGYTAVPIACLHENDWKTVIDANKNIYSNTGRGSFSTGNSYEKYATGDLIGAIGNTDSDATTTANAKIKTCYTGKLVDGLDANFAGQTIIVTEQRQFNAYDLGARNFVLGGNINIVTGKPYSKDFTGVNFDGNGYTVTLQEGTAATLFGTLTSCTVRNVKLAGTSLTFTSTSGALANHIKGTSTIEDVTSSITLNAGGSSTSVEHMAFGGIVGALGDENSSVKSIITIRNCTFSGTITATKNDSYKQRCVGGIAGHAFVGTKDDRIVFENCTNTGTITGTRAGGISSGVCLDGNKNEGKTEFQQAKVEFKNCTNKGSITCHQIAGGIIADASNRVILAYMDSKNTTTTKVHDFLKCPLPEVVIDGCLNSGNVTVDAYPGSTADYGHNNAIAIAGGIVATADRVTILNTINTGYVKNKHPTTPKETTTMVGGILGWKPNQSYDVTCGRAADGSLNGVHIENCKNAGRVEGFSGGIGGIAGVVWVGKMTIKRCVNTGYVVSMYDESYNGIFSDGAFDTTVSAAGILGLVQTWDANKVSSIMDGRADYVYRGSFRQWTYEQSEAAGIGIAIEGCVNAGKIEMKLASYRDADVWKMISGIVGPCKTGIKVIDCLHAGELEDNAEWYNSTFPIANPLEAWVVFDAPDWNTASADQKKETLRPTAVDYYGEKGLDGEIIPRNYYTPGSVDRVLTTSTYDYVGDNSEIRNHMGDKMYQYSVEASNEQVKLLMSNIDVYAFDRVTSLDEQVEFAYWVKDPKGFDDEGHWRGLVYTEEQQAKINAEIKNSEDLMAEKETDISDSVEGQVIKVYEPAIWRRQNEVYDQENALREAIMAYDDSKAEYEVIIPEIIPTNAEIVVTATLTNFPYYNGLEVTMQSENGYKLKYTDENSTTHWIDYDMWFEGEEDYLMFSQAITFEDIMADPKGQLVYNAKGDKAMKRSMIARVDRDANAEKPNGMYEDTVTFTAKITSATG